MTYYIKKLDNRHAMKKNGFTHMIEWTNVLRPKHGNRSHTEFYSLSKTASNLFGQSWSPYFNNQGKWSSASNVSRIPPRLYFKSEKYISLVLMSAEIPA